MREIKLKPSITSYDEFIKLTAEAMKDPSILKKKRPNERVLSLVRSDGSPPKN